MRRRSKRSFRQQYKAWWDRYWDEFRPYTYGRLSGLSHFYWGLKAGPHFNPMPKLRKKQFYPKEYPYYSKCPKWWNKTFHIRPVRREWKRFCQKASEWEGSVEYPHISEGTPYPSHKHHEYYY